MMTEHTPLVMRCGVQPADVEKVRSMVAATGYFSAAETLIAVELVEERLHKGAASGYEFVLAEADATLVGYACFGEIPCTVGSYDLYWIVVDAEHQRQGIGLQLMQAVEASVRQLGGRGIYIDTSGRDQYASTQRFYERCGYRVIAELPDFYGPGDAKLIYWRAL